MAKRVALESEKEAESYLGTMIEGQKIAARIEQKDGRDLVIFEQSRSFDERKIQQRIAANKQCSDVLIAKIKSMDRDIQREPKYVKKTLSEESEDKQDRSSYSKLSS